MKFHHIADTGDTQRGRLDGKASEDEQISPPFPLGLIVGTVVEQLPLHRAQVFPPQLLDVNQRPLPPTKGEVLEAGELEILFCWRPESWRYSSWLQLLITLP